MSTGLPPLKGVPTVRPPPESTPCDVFAGFRACAID